MDPCARTPASNGAVEFLRIGDPEFVPHAHARAPGRIGPARPGSPPDIANRGRLRGAAWTMGVYADGTPCRAPSRTRASMQFRKQSAAQVTLGRMDLGP